MGWIIPAVKGILIGIGSAATLGAAGTGALAAVIGGAVVVGASLAAKKVMDLFEVEMPKVDTDRSRQATVKSTTEPYKIIYGETLVSGPIAFVGTANTDNKDLYYAIALAGHEVTAITDMHFDDVVIPNSEIGSGATAGGNVSGSGIFGPKNSKTIVKINKYLGTSTQTADGDLTAAFTGWTSAHQGKGIAYIVTKWTLDEDSQETWDKYTPQNIKALVQGLAVYDPRLDAGGYGDDPTNALYIAYDAAGPNSEQGQNPALCLADYLINADYGMGIAASKIDWNAVVTAANGCDASVSVPGGTEKRFTCNGVLFGTDSHRTNINKILSSMNGNLSYVNGKYVMRAGIYEAPAISLDENDLISGLSIKTSLERGDRFNTIKGVFIDPSQNYKSTEFPEVQLADAVTRDNGEVLDKEIALNMTNSSYMAQRISNKLIQISDQQKVVNFPANLSAMRVAVGDRVQVSIEELSWSNKVFQCLGWTFSEEGGVNLTLREDSSTSYADPAVGDYSTITATGDITPGFRGVPSPSGLSATAGLKNNELDWVNPPNNKDFESIYVYASPNGNFSSAVKIGETDGTQFIHDFANGIDPVSPGDTRYYWIRAIRYVGTSTEARSNLEPNADPNTTVFAEVGRVEWSDVSGSTGAPEDNATVGATLGVDFYDIDDTTVLIDSGIRNQTVLNIEAEDVIAGNFVIGVTYVITSIGTTDFTLIGASANTVGLVFTATGAGSGTGTASDRSLITDESNVSLEVQTSGEVGLYTYTEVTALGAQYSVKIDNNGRVAGFGLSSTLPTDTTDPAFSEFVVIADKFQVVDPASTSSTPLSPFTVTASKIELNTDVVISGDLITSGTISSAGVTISGDLITLGTISAERIKIDNVTLDTDGSGNLIIKQDGVTSLQIAASAVGNTQLAGDAISKDKFQADVNPVELGATLPVTATQGDMFFLTTDNNLYRYNGTAWTKAITLTEVSDAGTLAARNDIDLTYVTDAGTLAGLSNIDLTYVTDAGALAALNNITLSYVTDAGTLAALNDITLSYVTDSGSLAALSSIDLSYVTDAGALAALSNIDLSYVTDSGDLAALNVVTSDYIAANAVIAGKIAAGAITTDKLAANSVTASKIAVVGRGAALNSDPNISDSASWTLYSGNTGTFTTISDGVVGNNVIRSGTPGGVGSWYNGNRIALDPNKTYRMTVVARKDSAADGTFYAGVAAFQGDGTNISGDGTQWAYGAASGISGSTTFTRYTMEFGAGTSYTFPSNAVTFAPLVILNYNSTAGYFEAQDIRIEEKIPASLIVDGTITADQIAANTITSAEIAANTITSAEIAAGTITASEIASATITTSQIASNTILAANIAAGTITSSEIAANTILAGNIAAATITGSKLAVNTVTASNIDTNTITASEIASNTITAAEIAANTITASEIAANTITSAEIAANTITASEIAANTITAGQIAAGAIGATEISVTNLAAISADLGTVTAGSLSATLISGDVTEKYAYSYSDAVTTLSGLTLLHDFVIPGPTGGISKRGLANITAEFSISRAGGTGNDEVVIECYLFRKSKGQSSILIGTVAAVSGSGSKRTIQISGDVTDQIGHYGACDSASDGSSIIDYRFIDSVWFDGNYTNIQLFRISGTDSWSVSDNVYYSADAFDTGTTTYYAFGRFVDGKYIIAGGSTQYMTIPIIGYFGKATDLTTLRLRAEVSSGATNSTVTFQKTQGVLENTR